MMKKNGLFIGLVAVLMMSAWVYFRPQQASMAKRNVDQLIVGTNAMFPPFEYKEDGNLVGFEIDLMREIGALLHKEIVFKDMPFDSLLMEAHAGKVQVIAAAMTPTQERRKQILFTKEYLANDPLIVITRTGNEIGSLNDLQGKEVVVNDGYTAEAYMKHETDIPVKSLQSPAEAFLALKTGRAYAYVSAQSAVQPFFDKQGKEKYSIFSLPVSDSYAIAVSKQFPDLFEKIENALHVLEKNGILHVLKEKWHLNFESKKS